MLNTPCFTIFTPTYNRAHTLHRVFDSLNIQTLRDFEWLVIDDGSTDNTASLVAAWMKSADFPIRYLRQDHLGKHFAHNRALVEARGYFFSCLDSDDALVPDALEKLARLWKTIPENERRAFYAVEGLCCDQSGKIVGDKYPTDRFDANLREMLYVHHLRGEKWRAGLTNVMRRYPFPEIAPGQYLPEGIVWLDIAKAYKTRAANEVVRIYYIDDTETGASVSKRASLGHYALGRWYYYIWLFNNDLEYFFRSPPPFLKAAVMLPIVSWYSGQTLKSAWHALKSVPASLLVGLTLPLSALIYAFDRARTSYWRSREGRVS
jgi:glycosyltransferase involved in cell wall biosynthesis